MDEKKVGGPMDIMRKQQLAAQLASEFAAAEASCALLIQELCAGLPESASVPRRRIPTRLFEEMSAFIDEVSFIQLKASARSLQLAYDQLDSGCRDGIDTCLAILRKTKQRCMTCRAWLAELSENSMNVAPLYEWEHQSEIESISGAAPDFSTGTGFGAKRYI